MITLGKKRNTRRRIVATTSEEIQKVRPRKSVLYKISRLVDQKLPTLPKFDLTLLNKFQLITWIAVGIYMSAITIFLLGPYFRLKKFTCSTESDNPCPDFVIPELKKFIHTLSYAQRFTKVESKIVANIPQAEQVTIQTIWPDQLHASILFHQPIANLSIPASSSAYLMSSTGQIMRVIDSPDPLYPLVVASSAADLILSEQIDKPSILTSLELIKSLYKINIKPIKIDVLSDQEIRVNLIDGKTIITTTLKPVAIQVHALQLILSQSTMGQVAQIIDVRLDRPVLKEHY